MPDAVTPFSDTLSTKGGAVTPGMKKKHGGTPPGLWPPLLGGPVSSLILPGSGSTLYDLLSVPLALLSR